MAGGHNKVGNCSEAQPKESSSQSIDLFWAAASGVRGVLGAPPPHGNTVASCG